jgi:hypothetical protein
MLADSSQSNSVVLSAMVKLNRRTNWPHSNVERRRSASNHFRAANRTAGSFG